MRAPMLPTPTARLERGPVQENWSLHRRPKSRRVARLGVVLAAGLLSAWPSRAEAVAVYYSVGTSTANLMTAGTRITIAAGVATFDRAQPANVGVGDEILYGPTAYISGRISSTRYSVIRAPVRPSRFGGPAATRASSAST